MQAISDEGDVTVWYYFTVCRTTSLFTLMHSMRTYTYTVLSLYTRTSGMADVHTAQYIK